MSESRVWKNGEMIDSSLAYENVLSHSLHYGSAAFEGIRFYQTKKGPAVFRLTDHIERLLYSMKTLGMDLPYSLDELNDATLTSVRESGLTAGYIRPLAYYGEGKLSLRPEQRKTNIMIAVLPWGKYLNAQAVDVEISQIKRMHPDSFDHRAKISGYYANSVLAATKLNHDKYHEALLLDHQGFIAEGPGENFFMVKAGQLITPQIASIFPGITRNTIIEIAENNNIAVIEKDILPKDVYQADEAFFCGTAAEVTPIRSIDDQLVSQGEIGEITRMIKKQYFDIVHGYNNNYLNYLSFSSAGNNCAAA